MTILEKIEKLLNGQGITVNNEPIEKIVYSPLSEMVEMWPKDLEAYDDEDDLVPIEPIEYNINSEHNYYYNKAEPTDEFKTIIERDDSKTYPEREEYTEYGRKYTRILTRYSKYYKDGYSTTHPDLKPSKGETVRGSYRPHCIYCGEEMYSIQANIDKYNDYSTTGYTCLCLHAELEKEQEYQLKKLEIEMYDRECEIKKAYNLRRNTKALLKLEQRMIKAEIERCDD